MCSPQLTRPEKLCPPISSRDSEIFSRWSQSRIQTITVLVGTLEMSKQKQEINVAVAIVAYSLCSSTLLLANKAAMIYLPRPSLISLIQVLVSLVIMLVLSLGFQIQIDKLEWWKVKKYLLYVLAFTISRYANMKALDQSNIETVIVFRSCAPLAVSFIEFYFMGRSFPSVRSLLSLVIVCVGAVTYCLSDSEFSLRGFAAYGWVSLYFLLLTFEMTYCKALTSSAQMATNWGPVFYCNFLAVLPMTLLSCLVGDIDSEVMEALRSIPWPGFLILFFSCLAGTFIG
jgi:drug/metabolite transporter (DMT)-like permease